MIRPLLVAALLALGTLAPASALYAAAPADPSCLGKDVSVLAEAAQPLGQNVVKPLSGGGFNDEVLGHLQGAPAVSTCPDDGFPSHVP